jgi:endogenous inhibitor of DNA gyrase (YacG/DUF329 family)
VITYEYPLNERIRTLLRLEDLFERSRHFIARTEPHDHHTALITLFEIMEVAGRADLKSDLLQELERQKQVLLSFRNNPDIAEDALAHVLRDIEQASQALFSMTGKIGQSRRLDRAALPAARRLGDHPAHPARVGQAAGAGGAAGHVPADARRQDRADAAPAPRPDRALRAGDQRQQVRAQHPLPAAERRRPAAAHRRLGCGVRADVLQSLKPRKVQCPRCGAETVYSLENKSRPFCSERCRLIDLGAWASESYRVPAAPDDAEPDSESPEKN